MNAVGTELFDGSGARTSTFGYAQGTSTFRAGYAPGTRNAQGVENRIGKPRSAYLCDGVLTHRARTPLRLPYVVGVGEGGCAQSDEAAVIL